MSERLFPKIVCSRMIEEEGTMRMQAILNNRRKLLKLMHKCSCEMNL